ncbi:diacylglycerol/lipid kinase family protein [Streptomyces sp. NBC_00829]|uniref:diacylglycerol/lipid kinase family protein n=1 Tax=Streptomyces sp. NBC_00829 TaxID=2903679 RepID=UPI00386DCB2B|nr:diacylglycerol kinase family lipid kinase [Streptomyces sp. NBC_00829]
MRHFTAIVNPTAGGSSGTAALLPLARLLREAGAKLDTEYSRSLHHARDLALRAGARGHVVLAVGGDGIAGCVGGALSGTGTVFGIVPAGRGNDFARALGLPDDTAALARLLVDGSPRAVDTIQLNSAKHAGTCVLGSVYAGVDAVANQYANNSRIFGGAAAYYTGGMRAVLTWKPAQYTITVDGERHQRRGYTVVAANSRFYGFGRQIAPDATLDDGLLDVVVIRHAPKRLFFTIMNELKTGAHVLRPEVEVLRGKEIRIEADRAMPYGADGEIEASLPVVARVRPGSLQVLC